jgi:hypothetical protein
MMNRMVGSVLTLVTLLFSVEAAVAQTYTQMQWGMNKGVTPYQFGANINGVWSNLGTVSSSGVWSIPVANLSGLGTAATQNIGTSGATVPLLNASNTWTPLQTFAAGITGLGTVDSGVWTVAAINVAPTWASLGLTPNSTAAAGANCTQINNLIYQASISSKREILLPAGGDTLYTNCTIDLKYTGVTFGSVVRDSIHDAGATPPTPRIAGVSMSTPIVSIRSPYGPTNGRMTGIWLKNVTIIGSGSTAAAVDVDSVTDGGLVGVNIIDSRSTTAAIYFHSGITGTDLGEAADIQRFWVEATVRQIGAGTPRTVPCARFDSSINANFSINQHVEISCQYYNQTAYVINSADNNQFYLRANRAGGGTGDTLLCGGPNPAKPSALVVGCDGNTFQYLSGTGAVVFEGTDTSGVTSGTRNEIAWLDSGNGTPYPTIGTDSIVDITSNLAYRTPFGMNKAAISDSAAGAIACKNRQTNESLRICNGSASGFWTDDGTATNVFAQRINAGVYEFLNIAGGGGIKFVPAVEFANPVTFSSLIGLKAYTVAGLAAVPCNAGRTGNMAYVTDATAPTYNGALVGGGTVKVPVFCDGAAWSSH